MFTQLRIKNFKTWRNEHCLDLASVTLMLVSCTACAGAAAGHDRRVRGTHRANVDLSDQLSQLLRVEP